MTLEDLKNYLEVEADYSAEEVDSMSPQDLVAAWLSYEGILGYAEQILDVVFAAFGISRSYLDKKFDSENYDDASEIELLTPIYFLNYLFYGDAEGLTSDEVALIDKVTEGYSAVYRDALDEEKHFSVFNDFTSLGGDVVLLTYVKG